MRKPKIGDKISIHLKNIQKSENNIIGLVMPRSELFSKDILVVKLNNGYNIGINKKNISRMKILEHYQRPKEEKKEVQQRTDLPKVSILHTGGTIASKVDYRTGAVVAKFTPEDILEMFPELRDSANIQSRQVFQMFSEDMEHEHWCVLAKEVYDEVINGVHGVAITHGTDTMGYTASALSFMLHKLPVPVIIVGSQRSSDRGSSDAYLNILSAVRFITNSDFVGVGICMHGTTSDTYCYIHNGTNTRKLHSSSRGAFKSINLPSIAKIFSDGKIEFLREDYPRRKDNANKVTNEFLLMNKFENKIGIVKIRPGFNVSELKYFEKLKYKGIVLEGTGLGHAPVTVLDEYTKHHKTILSYIKKLSKKMLIVMTTQCIYGTVNMNVYSSGRDLQSAGVIPANMLAETAYVKLGWVLGNSDNMESAKELFLKNIAGEFIDRITK